MTLERLREGGDPYWVDVMPAGEFLGLADKTVLHSGPPIEYGHMCGAHRRSVENACLFEGWAKSTDEARRLLESGAVKCEAACDYATDGSGYGIITRSVPLIIVEDRSVDCRAGLFPAEGRFGGGFCGWGVYSDDIAANLRWLGDTLFTDLVRVIKDCGGFALGALFAEARRMGDELHSCQKAIDALFTRAVAPLAMKCGNARELMEYFAGTDRFTHNFGQAACRAFLLGLEKRGGRGFLTAAGGNGVEYGIKVAGSSKWYTAPSPMIEGPYLVPGAKRENQLPWMGDSSITECRGWGGRIRTVNPAVTGGWTINGGMMDVDGGWMGAGSTRIPEECFSKAKEDGHVVELA